jgi:pSer/pThr/pTyr-binding forkhead associated (FHA) protein
MGEIKRKGDAKFRYIGSGKHPKAIDVHIGAGEVFTIGRFDVSANAKQSDFEFDKTTKAVSRRHAGIVRNANAYSLIDLSSAAGTFINGRKLPANMPFELANGCCVSFGYAGADYVWEE